jgi:hypothetical protein
VDNLNPSGDNDGCQTQTSGDDIFIDPQKDGSSLELQSVQRLAISEAGFPDRFNGSWNAN